MANEKNLIPFHTMPKDLHRELSRRGGKASGESRRAMRQRIEAEKAIQKAASELYLDNVHLLAECSRLLRNAQ